MDQAFWTRLKRRGVVAVGGAEAARFLQNLVTNDVEGIAEKGAGYGALLSPQGKIQFDFVMFRDGDRLWFDLPRDKAAGFAQRLTFYRLRTPVEIADHSHDYDVVALWGEDLPNVDQSVAYAPDPRQAGLGHRAIVVAGTSPAAGTEVDPELYDQRRIALGVPEGGIDFAYDDAFPHDADLDQLTGIDFTKGCYVGQEIVSRMEHRGTARRRIVQASAGDDLMPGAEIVADGKPVGTIGSSAGKAALAMVRIDRAGEAIADGATLQAGEVPVTLTIPAWAKFTWPPTQTDAP